MMRIDVLMRISSLTLLFSCVIAQESMVRYSVQFNNCSGSAYTVGCRDVRSYIINTLMLGLNFESEDVAATCQEGSRHCSVYFATGTDNGGIDNPGVLLLRDNIFSNCIGKPFCTGVVPTWSELPASNLSQECAAAGAQYLNRAMIKVTCVDPQTMQTTKVFTTPITTATTTSVIAKVSAVKQPEELPARGSFAQISGVTLYLCALLAMSSFLEGVVTDAV